MLYPALPWQSPLNSDRGPIMKYKDYYQILGIERTATLDEVKKAYRKLAHKYHLDVSKDPEGEEKFKEIAEAYATLKNADKRQEYDDLGKRPAGEDFAPPPQWQHDNGMDGSSFDDVDLSDLLNAFRSSGQRSQHQRAQRGEDYSVNVSVTLEQISSGASTDVSVALPEPDANGLLHRVSHTFRITIPRDASQGQRLRLGGKGGPGRNGGPAGDLYAVLTIAPHPVYRVSGRDLYFDLALSPWEAILGSSIEIPTLGGKLELNIKPGTSSGQKLRLPKRGLPAPQGGAGDLYAVIQIVVPKEISSQERALVEQLSDMATFKARPASLKEPV